MFAALLVTLVADQAVAQPSCVGPQPAVCPLGQVSGQDCRIDIDCTVASSAPDNQLDFGARRLVVTKTITVSGDGILRIAAGSVALEGSGTIRAVGLGPQSVDIVTTGDITMQEGAQIDVSSAGTLEFPGWGGSIYLTGANVHIDGTLRADGQGRDTDGGSIDVLASGDLRVADVDVRGGDRATGGDASLDADGTITLSGPVRCQASDGGTLSVDAGADVLSSAEILVQATGPGGYAGEIDIFAIGSIAVGGDVSGWGQEDIHEDGRADTGGDGAPVTVESLHGSVALDGNLDLHGAPSGLGGDLDVTADLDVTVAGKIWLGAEGISGTGGDATISAGQNLTIGEDIDAVSPGSGGGVYFDAGNMLSIVDNVRIRVDGAFGGVLALQSNCALQIASGVVLSALGEGGYPYASIDLQAASLTLGGTLQAGSENWLVYRTLTLQGTAKLIPAAPLPGPSPTAPCCDSCPTTTTTSTLPPTTTTSTVPPTTSSTLPPTTTTTTLRATTSTSTTTSSTTSTSAPASTSTTVTTTTLEPVTSTSASSTTLTSTTVIASTTIAPSTTTTAGEPASTTSTTVPPPGAECQDEADVAACRIDALNSTLGVSSIDGLGGKVTARRLKSLAVRAKKFLDSAENGAKVKANLRKARRELKSFERAVQQGLRRKRGTIDAVLGEVILGLARDVTNDVGVMQAQVR